MLSFAIGSECNVEQTQASGPPCLQVSPNPRKTQSFPKNSQCWQAIGKHLQSDEEIQGDYGYLHSSRVCSDRTPYACLVLPTTLAQFALFAQSSSRNGGAFRRAAETRSSHPRFISSHSAISNIHRSAPYLPLKHCELQLFDLRDRHLFAKRDLRRR